MPGPWELIALAVLALLIFGPDKLPGLLRGAGRTVGALRREARGAMHELKETGELDELRGVARDLRGETRELRRATDFGRATRRRPRGAKGMAAAAAGSLLGDDADESDDAAESSRSTSDAAAGDERDGEAVAAPQRNRRDQWRADRETAMAAQGPAPFDPDAT